MRFESELGCYLPTEIDFRASGMIVSWMRFGEKLLTEPFFDMSVRALRDLDRSLRIEKTGIDVLIRRARELRLIEPAGIIFHISRCGSTLLSNALRKFSKTVVLSENRPLDSLLQPHILNGFTFQSTSLRENTRLELLRSLLSIYGHHPGGYPNRTVVKCNAANILQISLAKSLWPSVPFVVVIRDPTEVIASVLESPSGWLDLRHDPSKVSALFGWNCREVQNIEEYCGRVVGSFCRAALTQIDERCKVVEYSNLNEQRFYQIARFFGLTIVAEREELLRFIGIYSKDVKQSQLFSRDAEVRSRKKSKAIVDAADRWSFVPYQELARKESW